MLADPLLRELADLSVALEPDGHWPAEQLQLLARAGVFGWNVPHEFGGTQLSNDAAVLGLIALGEACLTTAFIMTQYQAAVHRLVACGTAPTLARWLPGLACGESFATVGLSHLTTSRARGPGPAVRAVPLESGGYRLSGQIPWVTGGAFATIIVVGATTPDGQQILAVIERAADGVTIEPPLKLLSLTASWTGPITLESVIVEPDQILAGPAPSVMKMGATGGTGSITTSALALAAGQHSLQGVQGLAATSTDLAPIARQLSESAEKLRSDLLSAARDEAAAPSAEELRFETNSFAVRAAQCWITAAKGTGFVSGHPAERAVREAMFFYVWSCPQAVVSRHWQALATCDTDQAE